MGEDEMHCSAVMYHLVQLLDCHASLDGHHRALDAENARESPETEQIVAGECNVRRAACRAHDADLGWSETDSDDCTIIKHDARSCVRFPTQQQCHLQSAARRTVRDGRSGPALGQVTRLAMTIRCSLTLAQLVRRQSGSRSTSQSWSLSGAGQRQQSVVSRPVPRAM